MSSKPISPLLQTWYKWKSLRLPWRRRILIGLDLQGNTYWEFRIATGHPTGTNRWRRIVEYPPSTHYGDVKVPPKWHQWLRYMREKPPTLEEQSMDVARQARMKVLAAEADRRWEAKPKVMAPEETAAQLKAAGIGEAEKKNIDDDRTKAGGREARQTPKGPEEAPSKEAPESSSGPPATERAGKPKGPDQQPIQEESSKMDPWTRARGPSEDWQPKGWTPPQAKRRD